MNVIISNKNQALLANLTIDVIKTLNGVFTVDDLASQFKNFYYNKMIIDITALDNYEDINNIQSLSVALDMSKVILLLDDSPRVNSPFYLSGLVSMGIYNFTKNVDDIPFLIDNPNTYKDVANYHNLNITAEDTKLNDNHKDNSVGFIGQRIIGIKNVTDHAGATTLTYLLKKHLEKHYKVKAVELDNSDMVYFNDKNIDINVNSFEIKNYLNNLNNNETEVILIDMNKADIENYCTDVLYLIEPGLIQLNKLIKTDKQIFNKLKGKKIILNRSVLNEQDVNDFEKESGSKVFFNMPNIDDKLNDNKFVIKLLKDLGFTRISEKESFGFNLFR